MFFRLTTTADFDTRTKVYVSENDLYPDALFTDLRWYVYKMYKIGYSWTEEPILDFDREWEEFVKNSFPSSPIDSGTFSFTLTIWMPVVITAHDGTTSELLNTSQVNPTVTLTIDPII